MIPWLHNPRLQSGDQRRLLDLMGGLNREHLALRGGADNARYQLNLYVAASNLTNHNNYVGYSGVITSPFFGQPTNVMNPRKVELGVRFGF